MTGGIPAAARARTAGPSFGRAGLKARLAAAVADRDAAFAERDTIAAVAERDAIADERDAAVAERDEAAAALAAAQGRVSELERRLGMNSGNSHKPPSSDGFSKPATKKKASPGRRPGGQPGHKGTTMSLVETPDRVEDHHPDICRGCGASLAGAASEGYVRRQVADIPPVALETVEHRVHSAVCSGCGAVSAGRFPEGVKAPAQYGPGVRSTVRYLSAAQMIPRRRLAWLMRDLFGVVVSPGTVSALLDSGAERFSGFAEHVGAAAARAAVKHMDETGVRVDGRLRQFHVMCTELLSFFRLGESRGDVTVDATGIAVHDFQQPYWKIVGVSHAHCIAHLLRELEALTEFHGEAWSAEMSELLQRGAHEVNEAARAGETLSAEAAVRIEREYDRIIADAVAWHEALPPLVSGKRKRRGRRKKRKGLNLVLRLRDHRAGVLMFTRNPAVPATNNQAERDLRMLKAYLKISGCYRSERGARNHAVLRTLIETARKQGWDVLDALRADPEELKLRLVDS